MQGSFADCLVDLDSLAQEASDVAFKQPAAIFLVHPRERCPRKHTKVPAVLGLVETGLETWNSSRDEIGKVNG